MTRRHWIAVAIALVAMIVAAAGPLWVRVTGDQAFLEIRPVDPRSFFRGNYVDLDYSLDGLEDRLDLDDGDNFYAVFEPGRPARPVAVFEDRPSLQSGQFCVEGLIADGVRFPSLEQFFLPTEQALALERAGGTQMAEISVTGRCRAVLVDVVTR